MRGRCGDPERRRRARRGRRRGRRRRSCSTPAASRRRRACSSSSRRRTGSRSSIVGDGPLRDRVPGRARLRRARRAAEALRARGGRRGARRSARASASSAPRRWRTADPSSRARSAGCSTSSPTARRASTCRRGDVAALRDALERLLADPELRRTLRRSGPRARARAVLLGRRHRRDARGVRARVRRTAVARRRRGRARVGEPRVERQGERTLVGRVRTGERPCSRYAPSRCSAYVPICASMPCSRSARSASSRRSSCTTYACQPWTSSSSAEGVVTTPASRSVYASAMRVRAASSSSRRRTCGIPTAQRMSAEAVVRAGRRDLEVAARLDPVMAHPAHGVGDVVVGGRDGAAFASRDDLPRVEREAAEHAEAAARPPARARAERARRVLEQRDAVGHRRDERRPSRAAGRTGGPRALPACAR